MSKYAVRFLHIAESAIVDKADRLSIINIFQNISVVQLPAIHPQLAVVGSIYYTGTLADRPEGVKLEIRLIDPDGEQVVSIPQDLPLSDNDSGFISVISPLQINNTGKFKVDILIDNKTIESLDLTVNLLKR